MEEMAVVEAEEVPAVAHGDGVLAYVDGLLRQRESYFENIFADRGVPKQVLTLLGIIVVLSAFYGLVMGAANGLSWYLVTTPLKVPLLYLLTLVVCFPVLYVVNVVMGSRLGFLQTFALILVAMALNAILLASCATIVLFFILTGAKYAFIKLLHVAVFGFSGLWAMGGLWRGLSAMCETSDLYPKHAIRILQVWILVFGFVGMQTAWSLRPFIGNPEKDFEIFREQEGNIYQNVAVSLGDFFDLNLD